MDEARRLFGQRGFDGTTLDDVAAAAGVTKPIVYRHFTSKQALYLALLDKHSDDFPIFFEGVVIPEDGSLGAFMPAVLDRWFDYVKANGDSWRMLFRDAGGGDEIRTRRAGVSLEAREVIASVMALGGAVEAERVEPAAEFITMGLAGMALWWIDRPEVPKGRMVELASELLAPAFPAA